MASLFEANYSSSLFKEFSKQLSYSIRPIVRCIEFFTDFIRNQINKIYQFVCKQTRTAANSFFILKTPFHSSKMSWIDQMFHFVSVGSSARKRSSVQNGFTPTDIKIEAKSDAASPKPVTLRKSLILFNLVSISRTSYGFNDESLTINSAEVKVRRLTVKWAHQLVAILSFT